MGKGKGAVEYWAAVVKPGMFEVGGSFVSCKGGVTSCAQKLPVKTKFVVARDFEAIIYII
jgi:large subunit ribosomal protein L16